MERGDVVRPTAEAVELTRFRPTSRLRIREARRSRACGACTKKHGWAGTRLVRPGELYAASGEQSSTLCLAHVEPVEPA